MNLPGVSQLADRWLDYWQRNLTASVNDHRRLHRVFRRGVAVFVVTLVSMVIATGGLPVPVVVDTVAHLWLGGAVGTSALFTYRLAGQYRNGWLDGRQAMLASMREAHARRLSGEEWLTGEFARDMVTLGMPPGVADALTFADFADAPRDDGDEL